MWQKYKNQITLTVTGQRDTIYGNQGIEADGGAGIYLHKLHFILDEEIFDMGRQLLLVAGFVFEDDLAQFAGGSPGFEAVVIIAVDGLVGAHLFVILKAVS